MTRRLALSPNSRYSFETPLFTVDKPIEASFFGSFVPPEIEFRDTDTFITIEEKDKGRLDLLAYRFYGTPELWWVIALANDIFDPIEIEVGSVIRIPQNPAMLREKLEAGI